MHLLVGHAWTEEQQRREGALTADCAKGMTRITAACQLLCAY